MTLGEKLYELRKGKHLSQEEVANMLNVTRQTVSKWETDQSTPDFDKIIPICELYHISPNALFGKENEEAATVAQPVITSEPPQPSAEIDESKRMKKAVIIASSVVVYIVAVAWMVCSIPFFNVNPILATGIFLLIIAVGVAMDIFAGMVYQENKKHESLENLPPEQKLQKQIRDVMSAVVLMLYLLISFITGDWHITWIIWIIYMVVWEIIKLVFMLKEDKNEKE